jgi:hypothetical protein
MGSASAAWPARAVELPAFVHVEREEDLHELLGEGLLDEDTVHGLLDLLRTGVDLRAAGRDEVHSLPNLTYAEADAIVRHRDEGGGAVDPEALVAAGVVTGRKVRAIRAFLVEPSGGAPDGPPPGGEVRLLSHWIAGDARAPPTSMQLRFQAFQHLTAGVSGVLLRQRAGPVAFDGARGSLVADGAAVRPEVPKFFVQWRTGSWGAIAGTYRVGFAQGVTFDTTGAPRAEGFRPDDALRRGGEPSRACRQGAGELPSSPCAGPAQHGYTTPDFGWTDGLRGLAVSAPEVAVGPGAFELHGFVSWQTHSVYQYQLADPTACVDPAQGDCSAPPVLVRPSEPSAPAPAHAWQTLPRVHDVGLAGARVAYRFGARTRVGATAYGAGVRWRVPGVSLDLQDWARLPHGGPFGAVGVDASYGHGGVDAQVEVAHSVDSMPGGGGGLGAIGRVVAAAGAGELDASVRYYDARFANPYARPVTAPDRFGGLRARDELGARVRYAGHLPGPGLDLRAAGDLWYRPSLGVPRLHLRLRADRPFDGWAAGLEVDMTDRDVRRLGRAECFEGDTPVELTGVPVPCGGMRQHLTGRLEVSPSRALRLTARYRHTFVTDRHHEDRFRQDTSAWLTVRWNVTGPLRLVARLHHRFMDVSDNARREHAVRGYLEAAWRPDGGHLLRLRYEVIAWLDRRESTLMRTPSPVHWLWLETRVRFGPGG